MRTIEWHEGNIQRQEDRIVRAGPNMGTTQQAIVNSAQTEIIKSEQAIAKLREGKFTYVDYSRALIHLAERADKQRSEPGALRWYVAYHIAESMSDVCGFGTKDMASMVECGMEPLTTDPILLTKLALTDFCEMDFAEWIAECAAEEVEPEAKMQETLDHFLEWYDIK